MTAEEIITWIESARYSAVKVGLENMRLLLDKLGNPQNDVKCVHVAGTNGKGSVCAIVESIMREAGYKTGLYTSPYLMRYNERIRLSNEPIDDDTLVKCAYEVRRAYDWLYERGIKPSAFEIGTAVAFCAFREMKADVAVIETGLGGRLDPTNVIRPMACAITSISMDHMDVLGDTLELIAGEKAGIIKNGVPVVVYPATSSVTKVITNAANRVGAMVIYADDYEFKDLKRDPLGSSFAIDLPEFGLTSVRLRLPGAHQEQNARIGMLLASLLVKEGYNIKGDDVSRGVAATIWPGRLEWFDDGILLDGAHNVDGARALSGYINTYLHDKRIVLLTGMMADKQPSSYASIIAPYVSRAFTTRVNWNRAVEANKLADIYARLGVESIGIEGIENALDAAMAAKEKTAFCLWRDLYTW